jgi:hypothetical protein
VEKRLDGMVTGPDGKQMEKTQADLLAALEKFRDFVMDSYHDGMAEDTTSPEDFILKCAECFALNAEEADDGAPDTAAPARGCARCGVASLSAYCPKCESETMAPDPGADCAHDEWAHDECLNCGLQRDPGAAIDTAHAAAEGDER